MNDITPKEASEILSHYTDLGYGIIIEAEDTSKIIQALSLASKTLAHGTPITEGDCINRELLKKDIDAQISDFNELNKKGEPYKEFKDIRAILFGLFIGKNLIDNATPAPERPQGEPQGEWITDSDGLPICQKCGEIALQRIFVKMPHLIQDVRMVRSNYCPNCGRKMKGRFVE